MWTNIMEEEQKDIDKNLDIWRAGQEVKDEVEQDEVDINIVEDTVITSSAKDISVCAKCVQCGGEYKKEEMLECDVRGSDDWICLICSDKFRGYI